MLLVFRDVPDELSGHREQVTNFTWRSLLEAQREAQRAG
jgi:hypothetical protein